MLQPADLGFLHPAANSLSSHSLLPVTCLSRVNTLLNQQERSASGHRHNYFHNFPHFSLGNFVIRNGGSSSKRLQSSSSSSSGSSNRHRHQSAANQALIGSGGRIIDTSSLDVLSWVAGRANSIMVESAGNSGRKYKYTFTESYIHRHTDQGGGRHWAVYYTSTPKFYNNIFLFVGSKLLGLLLNFDWLAY